jgi:IS4 transposase
MILGSIFERFVNESPVSVMVQGAMAFAFQPKDIDDLFAHTAQQQYTRELLFSTVVDLMATVVLQIRPSVNAAYQADPDTIGVSLRALYDKLKGIETVTSAALVAHSANHLAAVIRKLGATLPSLLPGYRVRIIDGNHLAGTEHRLKELRDRRGGALPGQALVVLDPALLMVSQVLCGEDGHAQERFYLPKVLPLVRAREVWVADRNFCTTDFLFGLVARGASFVIRQHGQNVRWRKVGRRHYRGRSDTGHVYEQTVVLYGSQGQTLRARRITVELDQPTRDGDTEIHILTNVPVAAAAAVAIADLYRKRWTIEIAFGEIEQTLQGEVNTLAYPKAALFGFCVALVAYNVLAVVKAALRAVHGAKKVQEEVSPYYLADEISGVYRGMMIAIPEKSWRVFTKMGPAEMAKVLRELAGKVRLAAFRKHPRGPKKKGVKKRKGRINGHVSTARILAQRK